MVSLIHSQWGIVLITVLHVASVQNTPCSSHGPTPSPQHLRAYTSLGKELNSPNYPSWYPKHTICLWEIRASMGVVKVTFSDFDLEESVSCSRDYLEAIDGSGSRSIIGKYCGSLSPLVIYSSDSVLTLRFVSEGFITQNKGFRLWYQAVSAANASLFCSPTKSNNRLRHVGSSSGEIYSPNYPTNYPDSIRCTWILVVPDGKSVKLKFLEFDLMGHYSSDTCDDAHDYVEVRDGQSFMSPKKGRFCGDSINNQNLPVQISEGRYMWVRFYASYPKSSKWKGFRAHFEAVDLKAMFAPGVCSPAAPDSINNNLSLIGSYGTFTSPNYPSRYPASISCTWVIAVPVGKRVKLSFDTFHTEHHYPCDALSDYVEVRNGKSPYSAQIQSNCGSGTPKVIRSRDRYLWVRFKSNDNSRTYRGFTAHYQAVDKESIWEIVVGVVVGCFCLITIGICLVCCIKKRSDPRDAAARRSSSNPRQQRQRHQLLPKPEDGPRAPENATYHPPSVRYMPQPSLEVTAPYPTEPPPAYSEVIPPPPYPGPSAPLRGHPHPCQQEDTRNASAPPQD